VFGKDESSRKNLSPVTHVAKGKNIPPFLILHVADRPDSTAQSQLLAEKLKEAGVSVKVVAAEGTTHGTINANLGKSDDKPTLQMWEFMTASLSRADPALSEQIDKLKKLGARITLDDQSRVVGVNLGERRIVDADLAHLRGFQHLQEIDLTRTRITGAGLKHIKDFTSLRRLFLTETKVDDSGIKHLKGLKTLDLIGLSGTRVSDAGLDHLREMTELKSLFCIGTAVTDAGVNKLQRALPKCRITR
jgi:hypothetical protein